MAEAAPAAAPAPASPAAAEASEAADRAALIAELDADDGGDDGQTAPKPAKAPKGKTAAAASDDGDGDSADGDEPPGEGEDADADDGSDDGDADGEAVDFDSVEDYREHLKELVKDPRKLEEELGLEQGALKVNGAKIRWVNEQLTKADIAIRTAAAKEQEAAAIIQGAQQHYGPIVQAKQLFASGQPQGVLAAARAVEKHFGVPITQFVEAVVKAGRGEASAAQQADPRVATLEQTVQQLLAERQQQQAQAETAAAQTRHVAAIATKLKGTELAKLKDAPKRVYERILGSYDRTMGGYKLNLAEAVKAVANDPATKWELHELKRKNGAGGGKIVKQSGTTVTPPKQLTGPQRRRVAPPTKAATPAEKEAAEKAALIAQLDAEEKAEARRSRRA